MKALVVPIACATILVGCSSGTPTEKAAPAVTTTVTAAPLPAETVTSAPAPAVTVTVTAKPVAPPAPVKKVTPAITIDDGTWTVGEDVPSGTYKVVNAIDRSAGCYWAITKSGSNGDDIIANDFGGGGKPKVTLKKGQDFETTDCGTWLKQ